MLKKILIAVAVILVVLAVVIARQPSEFRVERSIAIAAPAAAIFAHVNDFHLWADWSPWEKMDPAMKRTYEGPAAGVGAMYAWAGNDKVGEGRMTMTESRPGELIGIKLEFLKPMTAVNTAEFAFKPEGDKTTVTWSMAGRNDNFMCKAFCLFMDMDKMVGGDFEKGLAALKVIAETPPTP